MAQPTIYAKLASMRREVPFMTKSGTNNSQNYNFLQEAQVTELFKGLCDTHGIWFEYNSKIVSIQPNASGKQILTTVEVHYAFVDVDTGERVEGSAVGQGTDANDKGVYKAITGAVKYIFMKNFLIVTGDDPEHEAGATSTPTVSGADTSNRGYLPEGQPFRD